MHIILSAKESSLNPASVIIRIYGVIILQSSRIGLHYTALGSVIYIRARLSHPLTVNSTALVIRHWMKICGSCFQTTSEFDLLYQP